MTKDLDYLWQRITDSDAENRILHEQLDLLRLEYSKLETRCMNAEASVGGFIDVKMRRWREDMINKIAKADDAAALALVISEIKASEDGY